MLRPAGLSPAHQHTSPPRHLSGYTTPLWAFAHSLLAPVDRQPQGQGPGHTAEAQDKPGEVAAQRGGSLLRIRDIAWPRDENSIRYGPTASIPLCAG